MDRHPLIYCDNYTWGNHEVLDIQKTSSVDRSHPYSPPQKRGLPEARRTRRAAAWSHNFLVPARQKLIKVLDVKDISMENPLVLGDHYESIISRKTYNQCFGKINSTSQCDVFVCFWVCDMRNYTARMFLEGVNIWYFHVFSWLDISNVDLCEQLADMFGPFAGGRWVVLYASIAAQLSRARAAACDNAAHVVIPPLNHSNTFPVPMLWLKSDTQSTVHIRSGWGGQPPTLRIKTQQPMLW